MAVTVITKENFETEVLNAAVPVLVDFWAAWCGPCRMLSPLVDQAAEKRTDVKVGKVNVDEEPELAERFEDAVSAERLPEEVTMRPSVANRLAKSHRIRTDTGIDITFPSAYAADQHFIEFDREADGGIVIRIHAASIENR